MQWSGSHTRHHTQWHCHPYAICAGCASPMHHWYAVDTQHMQNSITRDVPPNHLCDLAAYLLFLCTLYEPCGIVGQWNRAISYSPNQCWSNLQRGISLGLSNLRLVSIVILLKIQCKEENHKTFQNDKISFKLIVIPSKELWSCQHIDWLSHALLICLETLTHAWVSTEFLPKCLSDFRVVAALSAHNFTAWRFL